MPDIPDIEVESAAFLTAFGDELRRTREQRGWSRTDLIAASGLAVAVSTLAAQELGLRDMSAFELSRYCRALGIESGTVFDTVYRAALSSTNHLYVDLSSLADAATEPLRTWARACIDELPENTKTTVLLTDTSLDDLADRCGTSRSELIRVLRTAGMAHAPPGPPSAPSSATPTAADSLESLEHEDVLARWPFLAPIVELPGPSWRFLLAPRGMLACMRAHDSYAECLWVINESQVGLSRTPVHGRLGPAASTVDFAGSPDEVLAVLRQPVRWEDKP